MLKKQIKFAQQSNNEIKQFIKINLNYCLNNAAAERKITLSRIDYCNSQLFGSTHGVTSHLIRMQNYAARVMLLIQKSANIAIYLRSLHCLPVKVRSLYEMPSLCYHFHNSTAPSYVTDMLQKKPSHSRSVHTISHTMPLLNKTVYGRATLGDRSFSYASSVWNSIPKGVKCAPSMSSFQSRKIRLFRSV